MADVIPTRSPLGLLDLPSELRVMIFRHLLIDPYGMNVRDLGSPPDLKRSTTPSSLNIFRACRLIHREAFEVFYKENVFWYFLGDMHRNLDSYALNRIPFPLIVDTIQNLDVTIYLPDRLHRLAAIEDFLKFMPHIGRPSIIRGLFKVTFTLNGHSPQTSSIYLRWFVRALGRFTKFRTIELHFLNHFYNPYRKPDVISAKYSKFALEPVLGPAFSSEEDYGLRFHPVDHLNRLGGPDDVDWADHLGGLRLEWNEDSANAKDV